MKIEAKDLRIGNLVQQGTVEVLSDYLVIVNEIFYELKAIEPIPLTEEWLENFGKINWLYKDTYGFYFVVSDKRIYIKFVHSLQNIYFCIEKKELL